MTVVVRRFRMIRDYAHVAARLPGRTAAGLGLLKDYDGGSRVMGFDRCCRARAAESDDDDISV